MWDGRVVYGRQAIEAANEIDAQQLLLRSVASYTRTKKGKQGGVMIDRRNMHIVMVELRKGGKA
jgi:hypothetical protein